LVDLPEVVNDATVEIVRRAKRVFVVCTLETAPLALALQRCHELKSRGIPFGKIRVIVNRWQRGELEAKQVEELLSCPVSAVFGNDYMKVSEAAKRHTFVDPGSKLGRSYAAFARKLAGTPETSGSVLAFLKTLGARPEPQPQL
jgi:Flp pilus assembly CpaE family ATPase